MSVYNLTPAVPVTLIGEMQNKYGASFIMDPIPYFKQEMATNPAVQSYLESAGYHLALAPDRQAVQMATDEYEKYHSTTITSEKQYGSPTDTGPVVVVKQAGQASAMAGTPYQITPPIVNSLQQTPVVNTEPKIPNQNQPITQPQPMQTQQVSYTPSAEETQKMFGLARATTITKNESGKTVDISSRAVLAPTGYDPVMAKAQNAQQQAFGGPIGLPFGPVIGPIATSVEVAGKLRGAKSEVETGKPTIQVALATTSDILKTDIPIVSSLYQTGKYAAQGNLPEFSKSSISAGVELLGVTGLIGIKPKVGTIAVGEYEGSMAGTTVVGKAFTRVKPVIRSTKEFETKFMSHSEQPNELGISKGITISETSPIQSGKPMTWTPEVQSNIAKKLSGTATSSDYVVGIKRAKPSENIVDITSVTGFKPIGKSIGVFRETVFPEERIVSTGLTKSIEGQGKGITNKVLTFLKPKEITSPSYGTDYMIKTVQKEGDYGLAKSVTDASIKTQQKSFESQFTTRFVTPPVISQQSKQITTTKQQIKTTSNPTFDEIIIPKQKISIVQPMQYESRLSQSYQLVTEPTLKTSLLSEQSQTLMPELAFNTESLTAQSSESMTRQDTQQQTEQTQRQLQRLQTPTPSISTSARMISFGYAPPFAIPGFPIKSEGSGFGYNKKNKTKGRKTYTPSLIGIVSGRTIKKAPKMLTGAEIRLPVRRGKR